MIDAALDCGTLKLIETWGSDERIIEAARMSTQKGFEGWGPKCSKCSMRVIVTVEGISPADYEREGQKGCLHDADKPGDERLLAYLWKNRHATPFEMAGAIFEVEAPIFVFREWMRHRTQSFNEMSARYAPLPAKDWVPSVEDLLRGSKAGANKQAGTAGGVEPLADPEKAERLRAKMISHFGNGQYLYEELLREGAPKELARVVLPVSRMSRMRASANLRNWLAFLDLRNHPSAQAEIRGFASEIERVLAKRFPRTLEVYLSERAKR